MKQTVVTLPDGAAAQRLDVALAEALRVSRSQVQRWLKAGRIQVRGRLARANEPVDPGEVVTLAGDEEAAGLVVAVPELPVVYEDADMLVVEKPAGLAMHAGNGRTGEATVADFARRHTNDGDTERPGIVHRLDRDTSGLLVLAKTATAQRYLQEQWRERRVRKTYRLLVVGRLEPAEAVIELPLDRDPARPTRRRVMTGGRPAVTRYRTLATYPGYSYVEAYPQTGRTHQLRVHFAALGHPIAGDTMYGLARRPLGLRRQFLHAAALALTTPSGKELELESPLPADLKAVLTKLEGSYN